MAQFLGTATGRMLYHPQETRWCSGGHNLRRLRQITQKFASFGPPKGTQFFYIFPSSFVIFVETTPKMRQKCENAHEESCWVYTPQIEQHRHALI